MNNKPILNAGQIQDLYHYSLAIMGSANGLDANTLKKRVECGESAYRLISGLENDAFELEAVIPNPDRWSNESDMIQAGKALNERIKEIAMMCLICPRTGEETPLKHSNP